MCGCLLLVTMVRRFTPTCGPLFNVFNRSIKPPFVHAYSVRKIAPKEDIMSVAVQPLSVDRGPGCGRAQPGLFFRPCYNGCVGPAVRQWAERPWLCGGTTRVFYLAS